MILLFVQQREPVSQNPVPAMNGKTYESVRTGCAYGLEFWNAVIQADAEGISLCSYKCIKKGWCCRHPFFSYASHFPDFLECSYLECRPVRFRMQADRSVFKEMAGLYTRCCTIRGHCVWKKAEWKLFHPDPRTHHGIYKYLKYPAICRKPHDSAVRSAAGTGIPESGSCHEPAFAGQAWDAFPFHMFGASARRKYRFIFCSADYSG